MTNIKYIKRNRHPKRNHGGDSSGENGREETKSYYQNSIIEILFTGKRKNVFNYRKWNQLNFK